ncbi:MAG: D-arabinose 5-phosphate isomerase [Thiotrichales bacterium]|nr:MAG: D-arabinose 5-phosphate isomerase [Thiotrichales bacterium]
MPTVLDPKIIIQSGLDVIAIEARAVSSLKSSIDSQFVAAVTHIINCQGRVVTTGMGKSGHIARKIAATLASTGTPAIFVHPGEASHGDLGMITKDDVVIAFSYSGTTREIAVILPLLKRLAIPLISLTGDKTAILATESDVHIDVTVTEEACPLGLAPTASTTTVLAMGDALAIAALKARGFTSDDFALSHPGGKLGRKLLIKVSDIMHTGTQIPIVPATATVANALMEMSLKRLGMTTVVAENSNKIIGIFTDGDLRRTLENNIDIHATKISAVMSQQFATITPEMLAANAVNIMESNKITAIPVINADGTITGAVNIHDLFKAGVV